MVFDLHSHSTASDGSLSPQALVDRARQQGVKQLAITDHDSVDGVLALQHSPVDIGLIAGVELSCVWGKVLIHIVGLNIDPRAEVMARGLQQQQQARQQRACVIGQKLEKLGFSGAAEGARQLAGDSQLGRPHFARFLVEQGYVASENEAFKKYLGAGKAGDVKLMWPALHTVVSWIVDAGGVAVLAHPLHYRMTATKLRALITDFRQAGGLAVEVINGRQSADKTRTLGDLARRFDLLASLGSDFHRPGAPWSELGMMGDLPRDCVPVWSAWE